MGPRDAGGFARTGLGLVPASGAPMALLDCFDPEKSKITSRFLGQESVILFGGLDGTVRSYGLGLTPAGREKEAAIGQMLSSKAVMDDAYS